MGKARTTIGWVCVAFFVVSAGAHSIGGWSVLRPELEAKVDDAELVEAVGIAWRLGGAAMLIFAALVGDTLRRRARTPATSLAPVVLVGAGYAIYGAWAFVVSGFEPFFAVLFLLPGLVLAAVGWEPRS